MARKMIFAVTVERKHLCHVVHKKQKHSLWQMGSLLLSSMATTIIILISWIYWIIMTKLGLIIKKPPRKAISSTTRRLLLLKQSPAAVGVTLTFLLDLFFQLREIWLMGKAASCDWSQLVKMSISAFRILNWMISLSINDFFPYW